MDRRTFSFVLGLCTAMSACAGERNVRATSAAPVENAAAETATGTARTDTAARGSSTLQPRMHTTSMTEVVLDPTGRAALTLDADGHVRLWPKIRSREVESPLEIPVHEPVWMSLARTERGFVAGFIDTAGGAQVGRIDLSGGQPRWTTTFEVPSTQPLFELHVLDGGQRIVALGVDHRVHLWSAEGASLSQLDRVGFVPWQLRVAQPADGEPAIVAVLAGPVRVQPISITDDQLTLSGKPLSVALDRGPNRNDLALTPDGRTVLALQQRGRRSKRFELEIIDLDSGDRRIMAGESDVAFHPRVHPWDEHRALLETGSGKGMWLDFEHATQWPPLQGKPDRDALPLTAADTFELPESTRESMVHAVIADGHRVAVIADRLVVGALEKGSHHAIERRPFRPTATALDIDGERVAWATAHGIIVERIGSAAEPHTLAAPEGSPQLVAFATADHLVAMTPDGRVSLRDIADGEVIATHKVDFSWGIANSAWRPDRESGGGEIVLSSMRPAEPVHVLGIAGSTFSEARDIAHTDRNAWPESGKPRRMKSRDWLAEIGLAFDDVQLRPAEVLRTEPDPTGRRIAIAQKTAHRSNFDETAQRWVEGPHDFVITVYDRNENRRLWTLAAEGLTDIAWSGDGQRLAVSHPGLGLVLDAKTGSTIHERHDLGLTVAAKNTAPQER